METKRIGGILKNYIVSFRGDTPKPILITEEQHDSMWEKLNNGSREDWIRIVDAMNGDILFEGKLGAITGMKKLDDKKLHKFMGICQYGVLHEIVSSKDGASDGSMKCNCCERIGCYPDVFQKWIRDNHPDIIYDGDITDAMRNAAYLFFKPKP